jgi:hypothetical protein
MILKREAKTNSWSETTPRFQQGRKEETCLIDKPRNCRPISPMFLAKFKIMPVAINELR